MANAQLIQGARDLATSKGLNNGFIDAAENITKWAGVAQAELDERKASNARSDAKVAAYMDKIPDGAELPRIPEQTKPKVTAWLREGRAEYARHANAIRDLDPSDAEYHSHVEGMNKINAKFQRLDKNFNTLLSQKEDYVTSGEDGMKSLANKAEDLDFMDTVYTDEAEINIDEDGELTFGQNGVRFDEFPKRLDTDWDTTNKITDLWTKQKATGYKTGIDQYDQEGVSRTVRGMLGSVKHTQLQSLAADSEELFKQDLGIPDSLIYDVERKDELVEVLQRAFEAKAREDYQLGVANRVASDEAAFGIKKKQHAQMYPKQPKNTLDKFFKPPVDPAKQ